MLLFDLVQISLMNFSKKSVEILSPFLLYIIDCLLIPFLTKIVEPILNSFKITPFKTTSAINVKEKKKNPMKLCKKVYDLRWKLCSTRISLDDAFRILRIEEGTRSHAIFSSLARECPSGAYHIFDERKDVNEDFEKCEYIVFRHPYRRWVAWYIVKPFISSEMQNYSRSSEDFFWKKNEHLFEIIEYYYKKYRSLRTIKKHLNFNNWLDKPITDDGKQGILCRLSWKSLNLEKN